MYIFAELNGSCVTPDHKSGTGRLFKDCPELYKHRSNATGDILELLKKSMIEKRLDGKVVVCCQNFETTPSTTKPLSPCVNPDSIEGLCIPLRECPKLSDLFKKKATLTHRSLQFLRKSQCGIENGKPLVCCVAESEVTTKQPRWMSLLPQAPKCGSFPNLRLPDGKESNIDDFLWTVLLEYTKRQ